MATRPNDALEGGMSRRSFVTAAGAGVAALPLHGTLAAASGQSGAQATSLGDGVMAASAGAVQGAPQGSARESGQGARATGRPMPELEHPLGDPPDRRLGWAIVGVGDFAINQVLPRMAKTRFCRPTALVSGNRDKALAVARAYGIPETSVYGYNEFDRLRDDRAVDIAYIILPNALHAEYTIKAAQAGKHVLCEKPMAVTEEECQRMIDACQQAGRRLMIAYRAPFEPHNVEAIRMLRSGEVGAAKLISASHGRPLEVDKPRDQWRAQRALAGGGSLYDIGIYSLNGARYLTGEEPVEIRAAYRKPPGTPTMSGAKADVELGIEWTLRFPSGIVATCDSAYDHSDVKRMQVMAERATLILDPATDYMGNRLLVRTKEGEREKKMGSSEQQFIGEFDEMASAVRENREPNKPGKEGLTDVRLMQMIYRAAESGRPVEVINTRADR